MKKHEEKEYLVVYTRWIRDSTQSGETLVGTSGRKKEANGMAKSNFHSHLEMLITHKYPFYDYEIDMENLSIALSDEFGIWYFAKFFVLEV